MCAENSGGWGGGKTDGEVWERAGGENCLGAMRSAATELTCSHSLNSSAEASSLSVWGRWISAALHETSLPGSSHPRPSPIPLLVFSAHYGIKKKKDKGK